MKKITFFHEHLIKICLLSKRKLLLSLTLLYSLMSISQSIIYIDKDATGSNDGTSWQNAFTDLKSTLENIPNDSEVWIKGGTYIPSAAGSGLGINISAASLKIYGGFAGTEVQLSDRVFGANETIITGDVNGNDTSTPPVFSFSSPNTNDNITSLINISSFSDTDKTVLDGLTFTRSYSQVGSGALIFSGDDFPNITITNCKFSNNLHANGGAIYSNYLVGFTNQNSANLGININQCVFENNVAKLGAGLYLQNQDDFSSRFVSASINISNSLFVNNIITDDPVTTQGSVGSAMFIFQDDPQSTFNATVNNCTFSKNKELGTLLSNPANRYLIAVDKRATSYQQNVTISNSVFWGNTTSGNTLATSVGNTFGITSDINVANNISEDNFTNIPSGQQTNTLNTAPSFVDFANDDFALQGASIAVNAGDNNLVVGSFDLLNNQRIENTTVDLGAYEYSVPPCIVNIPDTVFKTALLDHGIGITGTNVGVIDTNGDGEIQCTEASAYSGRLILNNANAVGVADLTGIEFFDNTPYILLSGQSSLTSIDTSGNTALTFLDASNSSISTIDVTQNVNLETLSVYDAPNLTDLDVTQNTVLTFLELGLNDLSSLDLSANTILDSFVLEGNPNLSTLDFSNNTNLFDLTIENSGLTSIDLSNNGGLGEVGIYNNSNLTELNVANGNNGAITLANFTGNTALNCIQIDAGFTPPTNGNWVKDTTASYSGNCASLSVNDFETSDFKLYPNPASEILTIESNKTIIALEIYSVTGKRLSVIRNTNTIDASGLNNGMYFIKVTVENKNLSTLKFIKK